jgi:hypothetical protein
VVAEHVAVLDVGHLVAEDGGELGLVLHPGEEPGVDVERAVGVSEGVEGGILDHGQPVADLAVGGHGWRVHRADELLEIVDEQGVLVDPHLPDQLLLLRPRRGPELPLVRQRLEGGTRGRDRRQLGGGAGREERR